MIRIVIGTESELKLRAAEKAVARLGIEAVILGVNVASGVPNQPFGHDQALDGARTRARRVQDLTEPDDYVVGIENGLVHVGKHTFDVGYIVVVTPENVAHHYSTAGVIVPPEIVEAAIAAGLDKTVGSLEAERSGSDPADPHKVWSKGRTDRETLLADALYAILLTATAPEGES